MSPRQRPDAECPVRPGEPCTLCQLDVSGPQDCPLVYLVMSDDELRTELHERRVRVRQAAGDNRVHRARSGSAATAARP